MTTVQALPNSARRSAARRLAARRGATALRCAAYFLVIILIAAAVGAGVSALATLLPESKSSPREGFVVGGLSFGTLGAVFAFCTYDKWKSRPSRKARALAKTAKKNEADRRAIAARQALREDLEAYFTLRGSNVLQAALQAEEALEYVSRLEK